MVAFLTVCIRTAFTKITESLIVMFSHFYNSIRILESKAIFSRGDQVDCMVIKSYVMQK